MEMVSTGTARKGFFGSLFDLSFRHFVTGGVVKFLYVISAALVALNALLSAGYLSAILGAFVSAASDSAGAGVITGVLLFLFTAPLLTLFSVVYVRVFLEIVMVLFRISENTAEMARSLRAASEADGPEENPRAQATEQKGV